MSSAIELASGTAIRPIIEALLPRFEQASGRKVHATFAAWPHMKGKIRAGHAFDAAVLIPADIDELAAEGKIVSGSGAVVARSELGACVKAGAARPDIGTLDALVAALRSARGIALSDGPSGNFITGVIERLGLMAEIAPRLVKVPATREPVAAVVARGLADLGIQQIPELLPVPGIDILGPLPAGAQSTIRHVACLGSAVRDVEGAKALIAFLTGPAAAPVIIAKGMRPGDGQPFSSGV